MGPESVRGNKRTHDEAFPPKPLLKPTVGEKWTEVKIGWCASTIFSYTLQPLLETHTKKCVSSQTWDKLEKTIPTIKTCGDVEKIAIEVMNDTLKDNPEKRERIHSNLKQGLIAFSKKDPGAIPIFIKLITTR